MERLTDEIELSISREHLVSSALQRALCHRRYQQVRRDLEQVTACKKMRGGLVCLSVDRANDDYLLVRANPFGDTWRVDHMWDHGVREHVFLFDNQTQAATITSVDNELGQTTTRQANFRDLGRLHKFITTHSQERVDDGLMQQVVALEATLLESVHCNILPITNPA